MRPKKSLDQHFLKRDDLLAEIAQRAAPQPDDLVLEVGPGPGNLTRHLLATGAHVVAVEIDPRFATATPAALGAPANLTWLTADVLAAKNAWNPLVTEAIDREMASRARLVVAANLPYSIATPLLALLALSPWPLARAVVTVQLEVAERIVAAPGGKSYGVISVVIALTGSARLWKRIGRRSFYPPPKVESAIVEIDWRDPGERARAGDAARLARAVFPYRRKTLRAALLAARPDRLTGEEAARLAAPFGVSKRSEAMTPQEFVALAAALEESQAG